MENLSPIERGLKAKGIGPKGLKPIDKDTLVEIFRQLVEGELQEELVATFLMGYRVLENDPEQISMLDSVFEEFSSKLSSSLRVILEESSDDALGKVEGWLEALKRNSDLSIADCRGVIDYLLSAEGDNSFKAALLQGLRVKRESDEENKALLGRLLELAPHERLPYPSVIDLSEPYDGMTRNENLSLELAVILSLMGEKVVLHGVRGLGPKFGKGILDRVDAGVRCDAFLGKAAIEEAGLAILDQAQIWPEFNSLLELRNKIKKRPFLATMEKMLLPFAGESSLLVTGYVHSAYRDSIPSMLMANGIDKFMLVKGLEGGVQLRGGGKTEVFFPNEGSIESEMLEVETDGEASHWEKGGVLSTAQAILKFGLGREVGASTILDMKAMMVDGRFEKRMELIREFYPEPKTDQLY